MKKTVVVDLEYMRPSVGGGGRRSRSQSRSKSRSRSQSRSQSVKRGASRDSSDHEELNIKALLHDYNDDHDAAADETTTNEDDISDEWSDDDIIESSDTESDNELDVAKEHKQQTYPSVKDTDYAVDSDEDLLQSVIDEPTFPLDINAILSAMNKTENNTIANMTLKKITARRHEILSSLNLTKEKMEEFERKLHMYRVIEDPWDLKHNQLIRWIPLRSLETRPYVTLGGTLFRVRENVEEKVHIVTIRNIKKFVYNIRFELNVVFQRLSQEELMILRVVEYVEDADDV
jgi:hypothetical protein